MTDSRSPSADEPSSRRPGRRSYLRGFAAAAVASTVSLAGCLEPGETVWDHLGDDGSAGNDGRAPGGPPLPDEPPPVSEEPSYGDWFADVDNYQGTVVYRVDQTPATVTVGAAGNGGTLAFAPPAIAVAAGTTVEWEWASDAGAHNVVATEGAFDSGPPEDGRDAPFRRTFAEPGTHRYRCERHADDGMKGAVTVYDPDA